jgi:putative serine protease PepD
MTVPTGIPDPPGTTGIPDPPGTTGIPDPPGTTGIPEPPGAPPKPAEKQPKSSTLGRRIAVVASIVVVVAMLTSMTVWGVRTAHYVDTLGNRVSALQRQVGDLKEIDSRLATRIAAGSPDIPNISDKVSPSVFTIESGQSLGSSWVASSSQTGSDLVTNFHVVADLYNAGGRTVTVANPSKVMDGTIKSVSVSGDLALIHVTLQLPALRITTTKAQIGDPVVVFGSPLGLVGTVTSGIVSAYRTDQGVEYLQFSAPVSPGSSGGPVVDHNARVLGVTTEKAVETGAEGLGFAIQSKDVCKTFSLKC